VQTRVDTAYFLTVSDYQQVVRLENVENAQEAVDIHRFTDLVGLVDVRER